MNALLLTFVATTLLINISTECTLRRTFKIPESPVELIIEKSDITKNSAHIIVNAANEQLAGGSGVCGAIFTAAGWDKLQQACNKYPANNTVRCPVGEARVTDSFNLKKEGIQYIIHAVGPDCRIITNQTQQNILLANSYKNSLILAQQLNAQSIAFPFISSAIYACPKPQAAQVAIKTIGQYATDNVGTTLKSIHFVLFSQDDFDLFCNIAEKTFAQKNLSFLQIIFHALKNYFA